MTRKIKVAQFGLGPIGIECLKLLAVQDRMRLVGVVEIDQQKAEKQLGALPRSQILRGLHSAKSIELLREAPDLVFHTAVSSFRTAYEQLVPLVRRGISVVSSCEELVFPRLREPELAARLDELCRKSGARVVATGVNPGFVMDLLPLCLSGVSHGIKSIHVQRVVDASTRRESLQRKIGSGMEPKAFTRLLRAGKAGHAGLKESAALVVHSLCGATGDIRENGEAITASRDIRTRYLRVLKGQTCGLHQRAEMRVKGQLHVTLDLKMYLGAPDPHDAIQIQGNPPIDLKIMGGVAGDQATVAALLNTAPRLLRAQPGLKLLSELSLA
jgi:4-hydroxy-tetrahydrodipicolinate reductase